MATRKNTREVIVVGSKIKDMVRQAGMRCDGELVQAVSDKAHEMLHGAIASARASKRITVRRHDL